jgi:hypothetical protein
MYLVGGEFAVGRVALALWTVAHYIMGISDRRRPVEALAESFLHQRPGAEVV